MIMFLDRRSGSAGGQGRYQPGMASAAKESAD
jgi:hypothetical protein